MHPAKLETFRISIFRLSCKVYLPEGIHSKGKLNYPAKLEKETLGYFTDLEKAECYLSYPNKKAFWFLGEDHPFKIFEIEEQGTDYFMQFVRTRIYDRWGKLYGELTHPICFYWTQKIEFRFQPGDIVEFIHGGKLQVGIIAGLPPRYKPRKEMREERKEGQDGYILNEVNASGDAYLVHTLEGERHPFIYYCFPPSVALPEKLKKELQKLAAQ